MGYMLPLRFVKAGADLALCATRIVAVLSTDTLQARRILKEEKRAGTLINGAGKQGVKSVIVLDNGSIVASPFTVNRLLTAIEKSNSKTVGPLATKEPVRLNVYEVYDETPPENAEQDIADVLAFVDSQEDDGLEEESDTQIE